jgi:ureidoglycolate lyase
MISDSFSGGMHSGDHTVGFMANEPSDGRSPGEPVVQTLTADAFAPYGKVLDHISQAKTAAPAFHSTSSSFYRAALFDPGDDGEVDLLWVTYDRTDVPDRLEAHRLTEQALIPISGPVVQHVRRPDHRQESSESFLIRPGQGIVMYRRCLHATTSVEGEALCLMVSRASTTQDLADSLGQGATLTETVYDPPLFMDDSP